VLQVGVSQVAIFSFACVRVASGVAELAEGNSSFQSQLDFPDLHVRVVREVGRSTLDICRGNVIQAQIQAGLSRLQPSALSFFP
jgi:hypothetical protein